MRQPPTPRDRTAILRTLDPTDFADSRVRRLALWTTLAPASLQPLGTQALATTVAHRRANPFSPAATTDSWHSGPLHLGTMPGGHSVGLPENVLAKHLLTIGQSGAGKTTFFYRVLKDLEVPFWSFDRKQDYRHLLTERDDLLVLPWTQLKFNPLVPPPGVPPRRWAQVASELFGHATALLSGSKNHLVKSILELYRLYGIFDEQSPPYPSLHELTQYLSTEKINYVRKTANYRDTVLNRVEAMTLGAGTIFDCSQGYPLDELLDRNVIFEFDGLSRDTQNFVTESLLAWVYEYRLAQTQRADGLRHVVVLDEAKQIFSVYKERQDAAGIPAIDDLTAKLREFGEGLLVGDQEASKLTDSIKANTYTKVLLPTGDHKQFQAMAESMQFTDAQATAAQSLAIGEAIIQVGNDDPVQVTLDDYPLAKDVTDADLRRQQATQWADLSAEPRYRPARFEATLGTPEQPTGEPEILDDPPTQVSLSADADRLLRSVLDQPFISMTERYRVCPSHYAGWKAKTELVEAGLVRDRTVRTQTGTQKLLELTEAGRTYVEETLGLDPGHAGRGGIVHRYWQHQVQQVFEAAGWATALELFDADVYVNTGALELAVEIAMADSPRECEHVEKHLEQGFDAIWVVCRTPEIRDGLHRRLRTAGIDTYRVVVRVVSDVAEALSEWQD